MEGEEVIEDNKINAGVEEVRDAGRHIQTRNKRQE
jgi:hypothetical protein